MTICSSALLFAAFADHLHICDCHVTMLSGILIHAVLFCLGLRIFLHTVHFGIRNRARNRNRMADMSAQLVAVALELPSAALRVRCRCYLLASLRCWTLNSMRCAAFSTAISTSFLWTIRTTSQHPCFCLEVQSLVAGESLMPIPRQLSSRHLCVTIVTVETQPRLRRPWVCWPLPRSLPPSRLQQSYEYRTPTYHGSSFMISMNQKFVDSGDS
jgi:hypothetical protein